MIRITEVLERRFCFCGNGVKVDRDALHKLFALGGSDKSKLVAVGILISRFEFLPVYLSALTDKGMSTQVPIAGLIDERLISVEGQQPSLYMGDDDLKH
jgi:hypothetical protein